MTKCHDSLVSSVQVTELAQSIQDAATLPSRHRLAACLGLIAAAVPLADPCLRIWLTHNRTPRGYGTERQSARSQALPFSHPFLTLPSHKDSTNKQVSVIVFHWTRALARQSPPQTITGKCHLAPIHRSIGTGITRQAPIRQTSSSIPSISHRL